MQVLGYLKHWSNLDSIRPISIGPRCPNYRHGHTQSNPKSISPHVASNEALITCKDHTSVELCHV